MAQRFWVLADRGGVGARIAVALTLALAGACDDAPTAHEAVLTLELRGLPAHDTAVVGPYAAWLIDVDAGVTGLGRFGATGSATAVSFDVPAAVEAEAIMITLEAPGVQGRGPSDLRFLGGRFTGEAAQLSEVGYLTPNLPLEGAPGDFRLGVFGAGADPQALADADAGLWLIDPAGDTITGSAYLDFTPLTAAWTYEGWVVRDLGSTDEVWLSYGKFLPDEFRQARFRDDTGTGPFSGRADYVRALPEDVFMPGDDWVANPLQLPLPPGLTLPVDLNGCAACGEASRWTHVVTVEPFTDRDEDPWTAEPFFLRPYVSSIGEAAPQIGRPLTLDSGSLPSGSARIQR